MNPRIMLVAGEVSGDIHGANLVMDLKALKPDIEVSAVCGERLRATGARCLASIDELAHMGLVEVLRELPRIRALMNRLVADVESNRPDLAVLVDSPDFNLRLARRLKKKGIPVVLYVSPQLWAWRKGRVRQVRRLAREVLCILPFETGFYKQHRVPARYVGHPLVDDLEREGLLELSDTRFAKRLALLPGSRTMEVRALLPAMLGALKRLPPELVDDVVLIEAPGIGGAVDAVLGEDTPDTRIRRVRGDSRRTVLAGSALALTASGTATLECALLGVPMVVGYRLNAFSWWLAKLLVDVPHVALVNLIFEGRAVPELLQDDWNPEALADAASKLLVTNGAEQPTALATVRERLGDPGASMRAAKAILGHLPSKCFGGQPGVEE
jgi:lipid-A-disaccharide synthase